MSSRRRSSETKKEDEEGVIIMVLLPLYDQHGHLFLDVNGHLWLLDTGAPTSFGRSSTLTLEGMEFQVGDDYMGLTLDGLSQYIDIECEGLLGMDTLGRLDIVFDVPGGTAEFSPDRIELDGQAVPVEKIMGIPVVEVDAQGTTLRAFFDTGAQVSYFSREILSGAPAIGVVDDFYPGYGRFQTEIHEVTIRLGPAEFRLRGGCLPEGLGAVLTMTGTSAIVGNQALRERQIGFFPRRGQMVL